MSDTEPKREPKQDPPAEAVPFADAPCDDCGKRPWKWCWEQGSPSGENLYLCDTCKPTVQ